MNIDDHADIYVEKAGEQLAVALALAILRKTETVPVETAPTVAGTRHVARLRWRRRGWFSSTATRTRTYDRPGDAWNRAHKLEAAGYQVEVSIAQRTEWTIRQPATWSTGPVADAWREAGAL